MAKVFFGYPGNPVAGAEVLRNTARRLSEEAGIEASTWEDLDVAGHIVISRVLEAIDDADMTIFDVTWPNENVLFEAGYSIARAKPVWLTLDTTVASSLAAWRELAILKPVGYQTYRNSNELAGKFLSSRPDDTLTPVFDELIEQNLPDIPVSRDSLLYCQTFAPFEASMRLTSLVGKQPRRGINVISTDPSESSFEPLSWYGEKLAQSAGALISFAGQTRTRAKEYNRRYAFLAGMAVGFEVPVLMLAEEDYLAPFDYESRLKAYSSAQECEAFARDWLSSLRAESGVEFTRSGSRSRSKLGRLRFGEHVAENEVRRLSEYFIATAAYQEVVSARDSIFVGHRGTGKTANALHAYDEVAQNKTNLAVLIKPPGIEYPAIMAAVGRLQAQQHGYFFDALWRFVIQTEIAAAALARIDERPPGVPLADEEERFSAYLSGAPFDVRADLSVRLEQALDHLVATLAPSPEPARKDRDLINEAFHSSALVELRHHLGPVLKGRKRVAVFVDNLDKGWERGADFDVVARMILGLLVARGNVVRDFGKEDYWRDRVALTVAVFLRSDIYNYLRAAAREPDKLPISTIAWRDPSVLLRVLEERFLASDAAPADASEMWQDYVCETVRGVSTKQYLVETVLPRPRDLVYLCNAAVGYAIDRQHDRVQEDDFLSAEATYSQYAYDALLVENGVTIPEIRDGLLGFLGSPAVMSTGDALTALKLAGISEARLQLVFDKLVAASFFGLETHANRFTYPEVGTELAKASVQAAQLEENPLSRRVQIRKAFRTFLESIDP